MNTVKHWKDSNVQPLPKKHSRFEKRKFVSTMVFASLLGTYLDMIFTGLHLYAFPNRPFPELFSVNIAFTLAGIPVMTAVFLYVIEKCRGFAKGLFILLSSLLMAVVEKLAESLGLFIHESTWSHHYTFFGTLLFLLILLVYYKRC